MSEHLLATQGKGLKIHTYSNKKQTNDTQRAQEQQESCSNAAAGISWHRKTSFSAFPISLKEQGRGNTKAHTLCTLTNLLIWEA